MLDQKSFGLVQSTCIDSNPDNEWYTLTERSTVLMSRLSIAYGLRIA